MYLYNLSNTIITTVEPKNLAGNWCLMINLNSMQFQRQDSEHSELDMAQDWTDTISSATGTYAVIIFNYYIK